MSWGSSVAHDFSHYLVEHSPGKHSSSCSGTGGKKGRPNDDDDEEDDEASGLLVVFLWRG